MSALARAPAEPRSSVRPELTSFAGGRLPNWSYFVPNEHETNDAWRWPRCIDTIDEMRLDPQVAAIETIITLPPQDYRRELDPNGLDLAAAEKLADDLDVPLRGQEQPPGRSVERFDMGEHIARAVRMVGNGVQVFEIAGRIDEDGWWRLVDLQPVPLRTITRWDVDRAGRLRSIWQWDSSSLRDVEIPADHLVVYTWGGEPGDPTGRSMFRPLYRPVIAKDRFVRLDLLQKEKGAMGIPWGELPPDASKSDRELFEALLASLAAGEETNVIVPNGGRFGVAGVSGSVADVVASMEYQDKQMLRATATMVLAAGDTGHGTFSSAGEHGDLLSKVHDTIPARIMRVLTRAVVALWAKLNGFPPVARLVSLRPGEEAQTETYAYHLEYKLLTIDEARARIGLPPLPDGEGERFPESSEVQARIEEHGVQAAAAEFNQARQQHGLKPVSERVFLTAASGAMGGTRAPVAASGRRVREAPAGRTRRPVAAAAADVPVPDRRPRRQPTELEAAAGADFRQIDTDWQTAYDDIVAALVRGRDQLAETLLDAIRDMATVDPLTLADELAPILRRAADDQDTSTLQDALERAARDGIDQVIAEADRQGGSINPPDLDYADRAALEATNALRRLAASLVETASTAALTSTEPGAVGTVVADAVGQAVERLTDAQPEQAAGAATTRAQNAGRGHALSTADYTEIYGSALLDVKTCGPCIDWDGRTFETMEEALDQFPGGGGNKDCEGGDRCRCVLVGRLATEQERAT